MTTAPELSLLALTAPFCPQCVPSGQHTPSETFKIADSHPEVEERVEPLSPSRSPLFHNKHRYQKIGVHEVAAADGQRYNVLYLATGATGHTARRRERRGGHRSPRAQGLRSQPGICSAGRRELPSAGNSFQPGCVGTAGLQAASQARGRGAQPGPRVELKSFPNGAAPSFPGASPGCAHPSVCSVPGSALWHSWRGSQGFKSLVCD